MRSKAKQRRLCAVAVAMLLCLGACGRLDAGGENSAQTAPLTTAGQTELTAVTTTPAATTEPTVPTTGGFTTTPPAATTTTPVVTTASSESAAAPTTAPANSAPDTEASAGVWPETAATGHYIAAEISQYNARGNVLCGGNYLLEYFNTRTTGDADYAAALTAFAARYPQVRVSCMIVPKCASFQSPSDRTDPFENHRAYIEATYRQMSGVYTVDAFGEMAAHRGEYLFYRTDHHWTSLGAYYASAAFCRSCGITPREISSYQTVINTDFWGTLYTRYWGEDKPEGITADYTVGHLPQTGYTLKYTRDAAATVAEKTGTAINQKAQSYASMFIGGDHPFTDIVTENRNGRRILVFKESYGNAVVPYLIDYFEEILVVDSRYSTASVAEIIQKYGVTDALIINNIQAVSGQKALLRERLES